MVNHILLNLSNGIGIVFNLIWYENIILIYGIGVFDLFHIIFIYGIAVGFNSI